MRSAVVACVAFAACASCVDSTPPGTVGLRGKVVFQAPTDLVFQSRVAVGSRFVVIALGRNDETVLGDEADLRGDDDEVATVVVDEVKDGKVTATVEVTGPGRVTLAVVDGGETVDSIRIEAARAAVTTLVDARLLDSGDVVDATLPARFALLSSTRTRLLVSAVDKCGDAVLDLGASDLVVVDPVGGDPATVASVTADGPAAFLVEPLRIAGDFLLELRTRDLAPLAYDVTSVDLEDVDEVRAEVANVDTQASTARLWGRALANDVDVIGVGFRWTPSERVTLDTFDGPATTATISFPAQGEPADERPATVSAEVAGVAGTVDLLALQQGALVATRGEPPTRSGDSADAAGGLSCAQGCGGTSCDALAALLPAFSLRRLRRCHRQGSPAR